MKISVWDTYVEREDGNIMHFDILVPSDVTDEQTIFSFGMDYLKTKPFQTNQLSANECRLCHMEQATEEMITSIEKNNYTIIEMDNCS
jgi:hypothetical protein